MKQFKLKLRTKFIIILTIGIVSFGIINIFVVKKIVYKSLRESLDDNGIFISRNFVSKISDDILHDDKLFVQKDIEELSSIDNSISYVFVIDKNGKVISHNFKGDFPRGLISANSISINKRFNIRMIFDSFNKNIYRDIAWPLMDGELGVLRIGFSEKKIKYKVNKIVLILEGMVLLFLLIGFFSSFFISKFVIKPVSKIVNGFKNFDLDTPPAPIMINTGDEIENLSERFNEMAERLHREHCELKDINQKLIQIEKFSSIGTISASIAHEINNPLAGLKNCVNRLKKNPTWEEIEQYSDLMIKALDKIEESVKGLLNFSRIKNVKFNPLKIDKVIADTITLISYKLRDNKIEFKLDLKPDVYCVGDSNRLGQVFLNLFLNSIDAMSNGGRLNVMLRRDSNTINVEIEDTGCGIPEKYKNKIFDPFFTTKREYKGTGLGLPISYDIIKLHNGSMEISSKEGKGTKVLISLPFYKMEEN